MKKDKLSSVIDHTRWIRDYGHDPRHQEQLLAIPFKWHQLWTAIDVIDDVEMAIDSYERGAFPKEPGEQYLRVYGILQALYVQGDAVENFVEAIRPAIQIKAVDVFKDIRQARNASVGHPTKQGGKKTGLYAHTISRVTMSKRGFQLVSFSDQYKHATFTDIEIAALIEKQRKEVVRVLGEVVNELKNEDAEHKATHRDTKLSQPFHHELYAFEKISEGLSSKRELSLAKWGAEHLQKILDDFENLLKVRGLTVETYVGIKYNYEQIAYPLGELRKFLSGEKSEIPNNEAARVYEDALRGYFEELYEMAQELDNEYSEDADKG